MNFFIVGLVFLLFIMATSLEAQPVQDYPVNQCPFDDYSWYWPEFMHSMCSGDQDTHNWTITCSTLQLDHDADFHGECAEGLVCEEETGDDWGDEPTTAWCRNPTLSHSIAPDSSPSDSTPSDPPEARGTSYSDENDFTPSEHDDHNTNFATHRKVVY